MNLPRNILIYPEKAYVWNLATEIENETKNTEFNKDRELRWVGNLVFEVDLNQRTGTSTMDLSNEKHVFQLNAEFNHERSGYH